MLGLLVCAAAFVLPSGQPGAALAPAARAPLAPRPSVTMAGDNFGLTKLKNEGSYFFQGPSPKTVRAPPLEAGAREIARDRPSATGRAAAARLRTPLQQLRICRRAAAAPSPSPQFSLQRAQPLSPRRSQGPSGRLPGFFTPENFEDMEVSFRAIFVIGLGGASAVGLAAGLLGLY